LPAGDGARVATELEATVDDGAVLDQRRFEVDVEQVSRLEVVGGLAPGVEPVVVKHGLVVDFACRDHVAGGDDHPKL